MSILHAANDLWFNVILLFMVACFVIFMPLADRRISRRLGINIEHGVSQNPHAEQLLWLRRLMLYAIFVIYLGVNLYLVFFSRAAAADYQVHINPLNDLASSIQLDGSLVSVISAIESEGLSGIFSHIRVVKAADITQAAMNTLFYIPMGYLLPYVFDWFKKNIRRPAATSFICSFVTENLQLIFRRGCYDFDDMIFNSLGGLIGAALYQYLAFFVTHPTWKKELTRYYRFRKTAWKTALFPFGRTIDCGRVTLLASREEPIYDFYVKTLGFHLRGQKVPLDSDATSLLLRLGGMSVEFLCSNTDDPIPPQTIQLTARNLDRIRRRLESKGVQPSAYTEDLYSHRRCMTVAAPDGVRLVISE